MNIPMGRFRALHNLNRAEDSVDERRRSGRVLTDPVRCSAGVLLDLSSTGARFLARQRWRKGEMREIEFTLTDGSNPVRVKARYAWAKRRGLVNQIVGVKFEELSDTEALALTRLATRLVKCPWKRDAPKKINWEKLERDAERNGSSQEAA